jgi:hypothetical protein
MLQLIDLPEDVLGVIAGICSNETRAVLKQTCRKLCTVVDASVSSLVLHPLVSASVAAARYQRAHWLRTLTIEFATLELLLALFPAQTHASDAGSADRGELGSDDDAVLFGDPIQRMDSRSRIVSGSGVGSHPHRSPHHRPYLALSEVVILSIEPFSILLRDAPAGSRSLALPALHSLKLHCVPPLWFTRAMRHIHTLALQIEIARSTDQVCVSLSLISFEFLFRSSPS